ncbi:hypothetical protein Ping_3411 [Psychromonas ingrahamii 37]|uniref:Zorya protein ZorC EH domain-containing protein n=1 Tax=Psychromonas ingrahamii (strain DSM 17664 / CCUG 51855 / 37) TaxID=357804 RepID=A1T030_PSYIN|nr:EH signature domain-containing protein [Psychromonas ingrahamii]ABM05095.1 hypothetical protein Ping_3411 [Psychromonas ingrahamii 37]
MGELFKINQPKRIKPVAMMEAAFSIDNCSNESIFENLVLPQVPPRDVKQLIQLVMSSQSEKISLLEWFSIFDNENYFKQLSGEALINTQKALWKCILEIPKVTNIALWRMCLYFDKQYHMMPLLIMDAFQKHDRQIRLLDKQRGLVLKALSEQKASKIAYFSLQIGNKPEDFLACLGLPNQISLVVKAQEELENVLVEVWKPELCDNYVKIIKQYSYLQADTAVTKLLSLNKEKALNESPVLLDHLKEKYGPSSASSRWGMLSLQAQHQLRAVIGAGWFAEFKLFIFQLTSQELAKALSLSPKDINQLQKRVTFWSNYQSRFHSFRVFLPLKTATIIKNSSLSLPEHTLIESGWDLKETELCFLEFDNHIVVEYLRGNASGLKLYDKSEISISKLLTNEKLKVSKLAEIEFKKEHDHLFCWQNSCENMLRTEFEILPDDEITSFLIGGKSDVRQNYDHVTGLPRLSREDRSERQRCLGRSKGKRHENKAREFSTEVQLNSKGLDNNWIELEYSEGKNTIRAGAKFPNKKKPILSLRKTKAW